ncbi:MAG: crossover junction endodeoxyribonuclease RuvC [Bacteroidales bacterium]|jgi:Holliday junction resolvasome RuvABC endonuclease subunit
MISVGLDLSLASTGFAIIKNGEQVLASGVIKSKPSGDLPINETKRIVKIAETIVQKIDEVCPNKNPDIICIENLAFMARNTSALTQLAGLAHIVRTLLVEFGWKYCLVAPSTLKKFVTNSGRADKDIMMLEVFKRWGFSSMNSDICDAYALAKIGQAIIGSMETTTNEQKECLQLLKKQL